MVGKYKCSYDELVDIEKIVPNPKNNNKHPDKQIERLAKIIEFQGQRSPVVISNRSGFVVKGHGRLEAIKKLGWDKVAVDYQDYDSEAQEYADMTADNEIAKWAEFDTVALLEELPNLDIDTDMLGMLEVPKIETDEEKEVVEDEVPEKVEIRCKRGDVWKLGNHRLMCGDSTVITDFEKLMDGETNYIVFSDPPYGFNYVKKSDKSSIKNDGDEFEQVIKDSFSLTKSETYFICGDIKTARAFLRATEFLGNPKTAIVWSKPLQHHMHKFEPCYELVWYWGKNGSEEFYGKNVFECKREIDKMHPTIKPQELICYCLNSTKQKSVLDLFGGSGSTLIACEQLNRKCFMMELDEHYCDVIITRWENLTGKKAERIEE